MNSKNDILKLAKLVVGYGSGSSLTKLLTSVNASARKGEIVAIIGANGVGKSTLLKCIAGLGGFQDGNISIENRDLAELTIKERASMMAFVGTSEYVSPNLTVYELVSLGRFPHTNWIGKLTSKDKAVIESAISNVGLSSYHTRKIGVMSDGERQRAFIARALAQDTRIILLDEPTAFLDLPNRYELTFLLKDIVEKEKRTLIYTTHDLQIALRESDKIWLLNDKTLIEGAPEDLIIDNEFSRLFPQSRLVFEKESGGFKYPFESKGRIYVQGIGQEFQILQLAMERLKLEVVDGDKTPLVKSNSSKGKWLLDTGNKELEFVTVYSLCNYLKNEMFNY